MSVRRYHVLIEWDPESELWVTYVPTLNSISTYGATREEAIEMTREAIVGYLEALELDGQSIPEPEHVEVVELDVAVA